jgi:methylenetetrahydrofolate dehydrogenase (NADP+) / methenyltetrahydrofolate cyclohydrolase
MKLSGTEISEKILTTLRDKISISKKKKIPTLAVILIGDNPASLSYIKQKTKAADYIGADVKLFKYPDDISDLEIKKTIIKLNEDSSISGMIVQRPLPDLTPVKKETIDLVSSTKDVDGLAPSTNFIVPVALAIGEILKDIYYKKYTVFNTSDDFHYVHWLKDQQITVVGRGETAGKPIADYFISGKCFAINGPMDHKDKKQNKKRSNERSSNLECATSIIHSQTPHPEQIFKESDIIISCVGKSRVIFPKLLKRDVILISVGIWRDKEGKLHGDYESGEIEKIASFYTPTPGGVGPVNVACLMQNLVNATLNL